MPLKKKTNKRKMICDSRNLVPTVTPSDMLPAAGQVSTLAIVAVAACVAIAGGTTFKDCEGASSKLTIVVYGVIAGVKVPFPFPQPDACRGSGVTCPVQPGSEYTWQSSMSVDPSYPSMKLFVQIELHDSDNENVFCTMIAVVIKE
ncbi:PREDICTED: epididymal secretory protein E1-like [Priapulus caudatus]|uniref:Epididymal secretory protein E1-like n=1 Tax=Priapulus caudatus TaxID=37621 RepID=A0ABM1EPY6_PRICU|nr:PREDICTED: epididymal secretory protein E1-like [Priapulus caudatus]